MRAALLLTAALVWPLASLAQDETLADIRQELQVLFVEVQKLKRELSTTGSPSVNTGGATTIDRVNTIEQELSRLTARTEELTNRVDRVVTDGTNRIGDLEFRLCELESACDIASLGDTPTLGGGAAPATTGTSGTTIGTPSTAGTGGNTDLGIDTGGMELAVAEKDDFDRALGQLESGDFSNSAAGFQRFVETYPGSPLTAAAHLARGRALAGMNDTAGAARAYLESFSGDPNGKSAPQALLRLGQALGDLGQANEACVTLNEVGVRFPGGTEAAEAQASRTSLGCS